MPGFELFDISEYTEVSEVLKTGILMRYNFHTTRKNIWKAKELEQNICKKIGIKYAHLTSSGTAALITVMHAMGIGAYDEVIVPTFTFVASFESILSVGAIPILVDIDESLTLDPKSVEKAITSKTKMIMVVHMCGSMAKLDELKKISQKYNLILLEDACQAIGATYQGKYLGTIGDAGIFSFDFFKTVTCGEGGVILTNNPKYLKKSDAFSDHGHSHISSNRGEDNHEYLGLNYRISELHAAIGIAQWNKLDTFLNIQKRNHNVMMSVFSVIQNLQFREIPDIVGDSCSTISLIFPNEKITREIYNILKNENFGVFYWYDHNWHYIRKWNHLKNLKIMNTLYKEHKILLPNYKNQNFSLSDRIISRVITINISLLWSESESKSIAKSIKKTINKYL